MENKFEGMLSLKEASTIWNVDESTLRRAIINKKLKENIDVKKFGKQWVVLKESMVREYGVLDINKKSNESYSQQKELDVFCYASECFCMYMKKRKLTSFETSELFKTYNIYHYIYECFDYFHLGRIEDTIKDISLRIKKGIVYVG